MAGSGEKPRFSLTARRKDAPKGSKERVKLGAGFTGKYPGSFNFSMRDVEAIKLKDGTVIQLADYWLDLKDWLESDGRKPSGGGSSGGGFSSDGDSEIPFRAPPRREKDIA
jgi:hypothetical protein